MAEDRDYCNLPFYMQNTNNFCGYGGFQGYPTFHGGQNFHCPGPGNHFPEHNFRGGYGPFGHNFPIQYPQYFGPPRYLVPPRPQPPPLGHPHIGPPPIGPPPMGPPPVRPPPIGPPPEGPSPEGPPPRGPDQSRDDQHSFQPRFRPDFPPKKKFFDDKMMKSLLQCGLTKETIRCLPRDLLKLYEPGKCGLCCQTFDTMGVAHMHYISKNHQKKQKKWLSSRSDIGLHRFKEQPFKARDLYCELCDVHITSVIHSKSHYSGKPHRSVVEGRKIPKNPFLTQKGMEDRLDVLIRREKRCLKGVAEKEPKNEAKIVQPELYCEICETSVTCSEQMVMHLNGKRHLGKEKQHILKMMKCDISEATKDKDAVVEGEKEEQSQEVHEVTCEPKDVEENWEDF